MNGGVQPADCIAAAQNVEVVRPHAAATASDERLGEVGDIGTRISTSSDADDYCGTIKRGYMRRPSEQSFAKRVVPPIMLDFARWARSRFTN